MKRVALIIYLHHPTPTWQQSKCYLGNLLPRLQWQGIGVGGTCSTESTMMRTPVLVRAR